MRASRTIDERIAMVRLFSKFENARDVQRQWKDCFDTTPPHLTTISLVNKKFDENGTVEDLPRSGRPIVLTEEKLEEIGEMVTTDPQVSIRLGAVQAGIGKTSYNVAMKQLQFKPYRPTLIVDLNEDDFDRRSEFCEIWLEKLENDPNIIDQIFWSDEAKFNMNNTVNRHNCRYWARENPHIKYEIPNT
jgi:CTP-dependent riboflavin kinase